jgi:hypothetical protein
MALAQGEVRTADKPVRGVLVEVFEVPSSFQRCLPLASRRQLGERSLTRLGSTLTDGAGEFAIEYQHPLEAKSWWAARRPVHLWLAVSSCAADKSLELVHGESDVRHRAGLTETFTVCLDEEALPSASVAETAGAITTPESLERTRKAREAVSEALFETSKKQVAARADVRRDFRANVAPLLLDELSGVERDEHGAATDPDFVDAEGPVRKHSEARMVDAVERQFKSGAEAAMRLSGRISLTPGQMERIEASGTVDGDTVTVDERTLAATLEEDGDGVNPEDGQSVVSRVDSIRAFCRDRTKGEKCLFEEPPPEEPPEEPPDPEEPPEPAPDPEPVPLVEPQPDDRTDRIGAGLTREDLSAEIPSYVARILDEASILDPGSGLLPAPGEQLSEEQISAQSSFPSLTLPPGPAEVPAFFDFHDLQIAFKPVWSEVLDEGLIEDAEAAYERYVELGGDPSSATAGGGNGFADRFAWASFTNAMSLAVDVDTNRPPALVSRYIDATGEEWNALPKGHQDDLVAIAKDIDDLYALIQGNVTKKHDYIDNVGKGDFENFERTLRYIQSKSADYLEQAQRIVRFARSEIERRVASKSPVPSHRVVSALETRARSQYPATFFAANRKGRSVNFGLLITYRQRWRPVSYQVGELIKSIPLAPKEVRKYSKKVVMKEKRARKEVESNLASQKSETQSTTRAEAEIVQKAMEKTNFNANANGGFKIGVYDWTGATGMSQDMQNDSAENKKSFHEAVVKAAREYKHELKVELETESTFESEFQESGELINPNDEIAVTYLFYELQRRYQVFERLHRLTSVVLVAQEMPRPKEIDEDWIIAYRWILNRVLLDDGFKVALDYVAEGMVAEEHALAELRKSLSQQRDLVTDLKEDVSESRSLTESRYAALQRSMERTARAAQRRDGGGLFGFAKKLNSLSAVGSFTDRLFGSDEEKPETARIREAATRDAYERELERLRDLEGRIAAANNSLARATEEYTDRMSAHLANVVLVTELKNHLKDNVVYYMQAIWLHEPEHMRWLRLKDVPVPVFERGPREYAIRRNPTVGALANVTHLSTAIHEFETAAELEPVPPSGELPTVPLYQVADIDSLLGFRANYMIFAMKKPNALTDFMMEPFVERAAGGMGLTDPDDLGNMTLDEFSEYVCCLKERLSEEELDALREELQAQLKRLLQSPLRDDEEIVVPLDAMYIEALPSNRPVLENFKLLHRQIDAADAQEDLRLKKMEKLRYAQRILDGKLDDPEADARYVFEGDAGALAITQPTPGDEEGP